MRWCTKMATLGYRVVRSSDGKAATMRGAFTPPTWGFGKMYATRKGAEKLLSGLEAARDRFIDNRNDFISKWYRGWGTLSIHEVTIAEVEFEEEE